MRSQLLVHRHGKPRCFHVGARGLEVGLVTAAIKCDDRFAGRERFASLERNPLDMRDQFARDGRLRFRLDDASYSSIGHGDIAGRNAHKNASDRGKHARTMARPGSDHAFVVRTSTFSHHAGTSQSMIGEPNRKGQTAATPGVAALSACYAVALGGKLYKSTGRRGCAIHHAMTP